MSLKRRNVYLAWGAFHLAVVGVICTHETCWTLKRHLTIIPVRWDGAWEVLDTLPSALLASRSWVTTAVATYSNAAGIEAGYGYFAPNIPPTHALVFECHYSDGRVDYQRPEVRGDAAQLRLTTLIEQIGRTDYDPWRIELIKLLAQSTWREHHDTVWLRAFFGTVIPPTVREYRAGKQERTFHCLYVYDFRRETSKGEHTIR
jgi:hypothetical protein